MRFVVVVCFATLAIRSVAIAQITETPEAKAFAQTLKAASSACKLETTFVALNDCFAGAERPLWRSAHSESLGIYDQYRADERETMGLLDKKAISIDVAKQLSAIHVREFTERLNQFYAANQTQPRLPSAQTASSDGGLEGILRTFIQTAGAYGALQGHPAAPPPAPTHTRCYNVGSEVHCDTY